MGLFDGFVIDGQELLHLQSGTQEQRGACRACPAVRVPGDDQLAPGQLPTDICVLRVLALVCVLQGKRGEGAEGTLGFQVSDQEMMRDRGEG